MIEKGEEEMKYRIVVGEKGNEQGHIIDTTAKTDKGARIALTRALYPYLKDGWGRIEYDLYDDGRWQRMG